MTDDSQAAKEKTRATEGMGGKGFYDSYSAIQRQTVLLQAERLRRAAQALDLSGSEVACDRLRLRAGPQLDGGLSASSSTSDPRPARRPAWWSTVHNDQLGNDWNDLFANVKRPGGATCSMSPARCRPEASASAASTSRWRVPASIDLGMSFMAAHWLERRRPQMASPQHPVLRRHDGRGAPGDRGPRRTGDWCLFLRRRAARGEARRLARASRPCRRSSRIQDVPSGLAAGGQSPLPGLLARRRGAWRRTACSTRACLETFVFPLYFPRAAGRSARRFEREPDLQGGRLRDRRARQRVHPQSLTCANCWKTAWGRRDSTHGSYAAFARGFSDSAFRKGLFEPSASSAAEETERLSEATSSAASKRSSPQRRAGTSSTTVP